MNLPLAAYNLVQLILSPVFLPAAFLYIISRSKYRCQFKQRISGPKDYVSAGRESVIWIHTLSFGEVNAATTLINAVCDKWPHATIICSAGTESGYRSLKARAGDKVSLITFLPYDLYPLCVRLRSMVRPDCFVLVETDVWPNWLWSLHAAGTKMLFVNAAVSEKAAKALRRFPWLSRLLYGSFDLIAAQSGDDFKRFSSFCMGTRVVEAGSLKFDIPVPDDMEEIDRDVRRRLGFDLRDSIMVAGSTHPGEEDVLLDAFCIIRERIGLSLRLIIAPRKPERGEEIRELCRKRDLAAVLRTDIKDGARSEERHDVVIINTLGELKSCYTSAAVAFVGGSLVPVGGHNLLEPAACGAPVMFGPFVESCRDVAAALEAGGGGMTVRSCGDIVSRTLSILTDRHLRLKAGQAARRLVDMNKGAVARYVEMIETALGPSD